MRTNEPKISILLPTRGRTELLKRSIKSLVDNCWKKDNIEILIALDDDDTNTLLYFHEQIAPIPLGSNVYTKIYLFPRQGYHKIHNYYNTLAKYSVGDWLMCWNDDAIMIDSGYDQYIVNMTGQFKLLAFDTHNKHPNSIFPVLPTSWYTHFGHISPHPCVDSWVSQIAWVLDIMHRTDIRVLHDRFDLTGNNYDNTYNNRNETLLDNYNTIESNDKDFNNKYYVDLREKEMHSLADFMKNNNHDITAYHEILQGKRDPWAKMIAYDVNKQITSIKRD